MAMKIVRQFMNNVVKSTNIIGKVKKISYATVLFVGSILAAPCVLIIAIGAMFLELIIAVGKARALVTRGLSKSNKIDLNPNYRKMGFLFAIGASASVLGLWASPLYALQSGWLYARYVTKVLSGKDTSKCLYNSLEQLSDDGFIKPIFKAMKGAASIFLNKNEQPSIKDLVVCFVTSMYSAIIAPLFVPYKNP